VITGRGVWEGVKAELNASSEPPHTYLHAAHHILHSVHLPEDLGNGVGAAATGHTHAEIYHLRHKGGLVAAQTMHNLSIILTFDSMIFLLGIPKDEERVPVTKSR
jgi:hypothetical protein